MENALSSPENPSLVTRLFMNFFVFPQISVPGFTLFTPTKAAAILVLFRVPPPVRAILVQTWQLQSFQMINVTQKPFEETYPLYHIQCSLKAQPYRIVSLPAYDEIMTNIFQAWCHCSFRQSEKLVQKFMYTDQDEP